MAIYVSEKGGGQKKLPPAGTHIARCYSIIDIGSHVETYQGDAKTARKVRLGFELPNELEVFSEDRGKEPFTVPKEFTLSLHEKSSLRKTLEAWRGRPFTKLELDKFDLSNLMGAPALITLSHQPKRDGSGNFAKLLSIAPLMKGMQIPPAIMKPVEYSIHMGQDETFKNLPQWLQEKIAQCTEWKRPIPGQPTGGPIPADAAGPAQKPAEDLKQDDVPF